MEPFDRWCPFHCCLLTYLSFHFICFFNFFFFFFLFLKSSHAFKAYRDRMSTISEDLFLCLWNQKKDRRWLLLSDGFRTRYKTIHRRTSENGLWEWPLLWWGALNEVDSLLDISLEALCASLEEFLLLLGDACEDVDGFLGTSRLYIQVSKIQKIEKCEITERDSTTYSKFNGRREEVDTGFLGDSITARNTGQVDERRFDDSLLTLDSFEHGFGESITTG